MVVSCHHQSSRIRWILTVLLDSCVYSWITQSWTHQDHCLSQTSIPRVLVRRIDDLKKSIRRCQGSGIFRQCSPYVIDRRAYGWVTFILSLSLWILDSEPSDFNGSGIILTVTDICQPSCRFSFLRHCVFCRSDFSPLAHWSSLVLKQNERKRRCLSLLQRKITWILSHLTSSLMIRKKKVQLSTVLDDRQCKDRESSKPGEHLALGGPQGTVDSEEVVYHLWRLDLRIGWALLARERNVSRLCWLQVRW